ncbi:MAG: AI-2E family transporter [Archaeoglobales archaeon]|nr:MAG: AI-2E family transporter [Archaeoglobales archaeon]
MRDRWTAILIVCVIALLAFIAFFFSPLLDGIVMGIVFAYVAKPVKKRMEGKTGKLAAALLATLLIIVPIFILMFYGVFQGINQVIYLFSHQHEVEESLVNALRDAGIDEKYIEEIRAWIPNVISIIQSKVKLSAIDVTIRAIMFFMNFIISAIVCFYVLLDADDFVARAIRIIPEEKREEVARFIAELDETLLALWFGNFAFAVIIGIASIPFFIAFGIPYAPLLSGLMFLAALIPVFAEWMVLAPVALFLALKNLNTAILFTFIGFTFLYFVPEVVLRPHFVGYASRIHPLALLLAFVGGAIAGGAAGFFIAPMLVAIITAVYNYYTR